MPKKTFSEAFKDNILVCDGAMGTMLYEKGFYINRNYDELNLTDAPAVKLIHEAYLKAGAEIIETNTFGANRVKLTAFSLESKTRDINLAGVRIAKEAAGDAAYVAGSVGPIGKPVTSQGPVTPQEAKEAFKEQIGALAEGGVDLIILETFNDLKEIKIAIEAAQEVCQLPVIAQMSFAEEAKTARGNTPEEVAQELSQYDLAAIGVNCSSGPAVVLNVLQRMSMVYHGKLSAQPNAGSPHTVDGRMLYMASPTYYAEFARKFINAGASFIGCCCGSTPEHIFEVKNMVKMLRPGKAIEVPIEVKLKPGKEVTKVEAAQPQEKSKLGAKLGKEFVVLVELDSPRGTDPSKVLAGAKFLKENGVDAINVADSPRATARMHNIPMCELIQQQVGIETVLHVCCRDRNLIALQSDLIGAYALGIKNLCIITGDPPKLGDYPDCTAVYDVDSIGLARITNLLNHGMDMAGNPIMPPTKLLIGVGADPGSVDLDREISRFEQKVDAGAEYVMTQPVYDIKNLENFLKRTSHIKIPVIIGIIPLRSYKNAEFLHNEVPGMQIPEPIRERMRLAGENGAMEGIKIAQEALREVKTMVQGVYMMPPFNRVDLAIEVLQVI